MKKPEFWQTKSLFEMSKREWESVCDGCAKCCLYQLEDEDTQQLVFTDVACDFLDGDRCRCTDYENRSQNVPTCLTMTPENVAECAEFAPSTCSYRLLLEGKALPEWHHLLSGDTQTVHATNNSVQGRVTKASSIDLRELENHVVDWPNLVS